MASATGRRLMWLVVGGVLILIVIYVLTPGTHPPPFKVIGAATSDDLKATCNDPKLHFVGFPLDDEAEVAQGIRVRIKPEHRSFKNEPGDLVQGRVVALIQLRQGPGYPPFGLTDTAGACMFVSGQHPDSLVTTIISKKGEKLADGIRTRAHPKFHLLPEAHWQEDSVVGAGIDPGPRPLFAESPGRVGLASAGARWMKAVVKAYSQTSCTNHSCCVSIGPKLVGVN